MTNKKIRSKAFKWAREHGFQYYWAQKYASFIAKGGEASDWVGYLWKQGWLSSYRVEYYPSDDAEYGIATATLGKTVFEYYEDSNCLVQLH